MKGSRFHHPKKITFAELPGVLYFKNTWFFLDFGVRKLPLEAKPWVRRIPANLAVFGHGYKKMSLQKIGALINITTFKVFKMMVKRFFLVVSSFFLICNFATPSKKSIHYRVAEKITLLCCFFCLVFVFFRDSDILLAWLLISTMESEISTRNW